MDTLLPYPEGFLWTRVTALILILVESIPSAHIWTMVSDGHFLGSFVLWAMQPPFLTIVHFESALSGAVPILPES